MSYKVIYEAADIRDMLKTDPIIRLAYSLALKSFDASRTEEERDECRKEALAILDKLASD